MDLARLARIIEDGAMPLVRTDFSSEDAWQRLVAEVERESDLGGGDRYAPNVRPVSDQAFDGGTPQSLARDWSRDCHGFVILADAQSLREVLDRGEPTVVLVDLYADEEDEELGELFGSSFRCAVSHVAAVEANLSLGNTDFSELAGSVDEHGVLRDV